MTWMPQNHNIFKKWPTLTIPRLHLVILFKSMLIWASKAAALLSKFEQKIEIEKIMPEYFFPLFNLIIFWTGSAPQGKERTSTAFAQTIFGGYHTKSLQNRLLMVCYVPATNAGLSRLLFCSGH
jgi:hypothetical protein